MKFKGMSTVLLVSLEESSSLFRVVIVLITVITCWVQSKMT